MPDLLFTFTPPAPVAAPKPKPLHLRGEDELLDYLHGMQMRLTMDQERSIEKMAQRAVQEWELRRNSQWRGPDPIHFATMPTHTWTPEMAVRPEPPVALTYSTITVKLPPYCTHEEALFLAERMIREQIGTSHLPE